MSLTIITYDVILVSARRIYSVSPKGPSENPGTNDNLCDPSVSLNLGQQQRRQTEHHALISLPVVYMMLVVSASVDP